jgi:hypothetical protein
MTGATAKTITRPMLIRLEDEGKFGPAMEALPSDRMRAFVIALLNQGGRGLVRAYMTAGYSGDPNSTTLSTEAFRLAHDDRIQEAMREEAMRRMGGAGILAVSTLLDIMQDDAIKPNLKAKVAGMILNRTGMHETTEHKVSVKKELNEADKLAAIEKLAGILGVDPKTLLGEQYQPKEIAGPVVDAEFSVVEEIIPTSEGLEDLLG